MNSNIFGNFHLSLEEERTNVTKLEITHEISLPPIFKAFCETFLINSLKPDDGFRIYHPDEELGFDGFQFTLDELFMYYMEVGEPHTGRKMFPIATSDIHAGGICVSIGGTEPDRIFVNDEMADNQFVEIASDILDFIGQLRQFKIS